MSIPTVNSLALSLMKEFGEDTSNSDLVSQIESYIQDVFDEIGIRSEWKYQWLINTITTVNGQRTYNLNTTLDQQIAAQISTTNLPLIYKKRQQLMEMGIDLDLLGTPSYWYDESYDSVNEIFVIGLYPKPNLIVSIDFLGQLVPVELASGSKLPFPRKFLFVLKDGVRYRINLDDKKVEVASAFKASFRENIEILKAKETTNAVKQRMYVQDIGYTSDPLVRFPPDHFRN